MAVVRWQFYDPTTLSSYELEINPADGGSPSYRKAIVYQNTSAPDGKVLMFEGQDETKEMEITGTILTEEHYNALLLWYTKRHQIQITDDLGRVFMVYITAFEPKRERAVHSPWKHSYTLRYTVLDWD